MNDCTQTNPSDAPAHEHGDFKECRLCGCQFAASKPWQAFCCVDHKSAHERVMTDLLKEIRGPLWAAAERLAEARR